MATKISAEKRFMASQLREVARQNAIRELRLKREEENKKKRMKNRDEKMEKLGSERR